MNRPWIQLKTFDVAVISPAHASSKPSTQEDVPGVSDGMARHEIPCRLKRHVFPSLPHIETLDEHHPTTFFLKITYLRIALKTGRRISYRHQCAPNKNKGVPL